MKIAIDVMGGDNSPSINIDGVFQYIKNKPSDNIHFLLVGNKSLIEKYLKNKSSDYISIIDAKQVIDNNDKPSRVFKTKPNSSIVQSICLLKDNKVDAVISAGNTGALLATSLFLIGTIHNIKRPVLAPYIPSANKGFILCDAGANVDAKPEHLIQFAIMSKCYLENVENIKDPKIALLNIGKESNKGNELVKQVYPLLKDKFDNFIGNIEPRYILNESMDILICDGFTGNIVLKLTEGMFNDIFDWMKKLKKNKDNTLIKDYFIKDMKNKFDYQQHGGTPILGIKKIIIKCHGSSTADSITKSIKTAKIFYEKKIIKNIEKSISCQLENVLK